MEDCRGEAIIREAIFMVALLAIISLAAYFSPLVSMIFWLIFFVLMMWCHALKEFPDEPLSLLMRLKSFPDQAAYIALPFSSVVAHFIYLINSG